MPQKGGKDTKNREGINPEDIALPSDSEDDLREEEYQEEEILKQLQINQQRQAKDTRLLQKEQKEQTKLLQQLCQSMNNLASILDRANKQPPPAVTNTTTVTTGATAVNNGQQSAGATGGGNPIQQPPTFTGTGARPKTSSPYYHNTNIQRENNQLSQQDVSSYNNTLSDSTMTQLHQTMQQAINQMRGNTQTHYVPQQQTDLQPPTLQQQQPQQQQQQQHVNTPNPGQNTDVDTYLNHYLQVNQQQVPQGLGEQTTASQIKNVISNSP